MHSTIATANGGPSGIPAAGGTPRLDSIDLLRGAIMILMSLDHVRDYFTHLQFPPENLAQTWTALFFTRWVTHFCAPLFFLLAGLGATLSAARGRSPHDVRQVLWTRGLLLVLLELTVLGFIWTFIPGWSFGGVIWALGWSMVLLSVIIRLPVRWVAVLALATIFLHNTLDPIRPEQLGAVGPFWGLLHAPTFIPIAPQYGMWFAAYVLIPWFAVMAAGYALGSLFTMDGARRRRMLVMMGVSAVVLFVALRSTNLYGNPVAPAALVSPGNFHVQPTLDKTIILFLDVEKYPPSLQYLLMTLGPGLIALAFLERINIRARGLVAFVASKIVVFGRVPLFYYVLHILLAHVLTVPVALLLDQPWDARLIGGPILSGPPAPGYGLNLRGIYVVWILVNLLLYVPCRWFAEYKRTHSQRWLTYV
jgi:uncharacterized membrane protein